MADDLANLQQDMRNAARELDAGQRAASAKLREALEGVDQSDLETRLQRTADWLRTGIDPNGNGTEAQIASGLQRLSDQVHQAQQALAAGTPAPTDTNGAESALSNVERLRRQLEALRGQAGQQNAGQQQGQGAQNSGGQSQGRGNYQTGSLSRDGQPGQPGQAGDQQGQAGDRNGQRDTQPGAGGRNGTLYGDFDTGNNARPGPARGAPPQQTPAIDNQRAIQQGVNELNQIRRATANDPEMQRQIQELISEMEHLDLRRFPGNPAMVEELHQRLLSGVDTLELQLRRSLDDKNPNQARSADSLTVPSGYKDAVAEYFRRLSTITRPKDQNKDDRRR